MQNKSEGKKEKVAVVRKPFFKRKRIRILLIVIAVLVIFRLFLPTIVLHYCNKTLASMNGYYGHIDDIDISLYRGAYQINDIYINEKDPSTGKQTDFFKAKNIDLSVEWKALLHGSLVGELEFDSPVLIFTKDKTELSDVKKDTSDFRKVLKNFMPLKVNRFEINKGSMHYVDKTSQPRVDISLKNLHVLALNLKNAADSTTVLPSTVDASANAYGGEVTANMKLNALAEEATFDLNSEIKNVNLVLLNDFLKAYGNFDVTRGTFGMYTEFAAKNGNFKGYVKPLIKDLDVVGPDDRKDAFFNKVWETIVGGVGVIFKNQKKDQIATKIPMEGNFKDPKTNTLDAIWEVLRNAFIQALMPSVDNQISINSVGNEEQKDKRNLFQRIFGKGEKEKKENVKDKEKKKK